MEDGWIKKVLLGAAEIWEGAYVKVGEEVGFEFGCLVGCADGWEVGCLDGWFDGCTVGEREG